MAITGWFNSGYPQYDTEVPVGDNIKIKVDGDLQDLTRSPTAHWNGAFTAEGNGKKDCTTFDGYGTVIGPEWADTLNLGSMPNKPMTITVTLWGNSSAWAYRQCPPGY